MGAGAEGNGTRLLLLFTKTKTIKSFSDIEIYNITELTSIN